MSHLSLSTDLLSSCSVRWCVTISGWLSLELTSSELQSRQELLAFEASVFILVSRHIRHCSDELDGPRRAGETATGCPRKSVPKITEGGRLRRPKHPCVQRYHCLLPHVCTLVSLSVFRELTVVFGSNLGLFLSKALQGSLQTICINQTVLLRCYFI